MKKCPYCAEEIQDEAVVCRFCNRDLRTGMSAQPEQPVQAAAQAAAQPQYPQYPQYQQYPQVPVMQPVQQEESMGCGWGLLAFLIPLVGFIVGLVFMGQPHSKKKGRDMVIVAVVTFIVSFVIIMISTLAQMN